MENKSKTNPFKVPENYFNEVQQTILLATINNQVKPNSAKIKYLYLYKYTAAAAILAFVSWFTFSQLTGIKPTQTNTLILSDLIDETTLIDELSTTDLTENYQLNTQSQSDAKIDYLIQNDVELDEIIDAY